MILNTCHIKSKTSQYLHRSMTTGPELGNFMEKLSILRITNPKKCRSKGKGIVFIIILPAEVDFKELQHTMRSSALRKLKMHSRLLNTPTNEEECHSRAKLPTTPNINPTKSSPPGKEAVLLSQEEQAGSKGKPAIKQYLSP